jgi:hypothetical protein
MRRHEASPTRRKLFGFPQLGANRMRGVGKDRLIVRITMPPVE